MAGFLRDAVDEDEGSAAAAGALAEVDDAALRYATRKLLADVGLLFAAAEEEEDEEDAEDDADREASGALLDEADRNLLRSEEFLVRPRGGGRKRAPLGRRVASCLCTKQTLVRLMVVAVLVAAVILAVVFLPLKQWIPAALAWIAELGWLGPVVFLGLYVACNLLFVPGAFLSLAAGFIWGVWLGSALVWLGAMLGSHAAFLLGRSVFRYWGSWVTANSAKAALISRVVARNGWKFILLLRISPVMPYNALNYMLSIVQGVRLHHYTISTGVGMAPGVFLYVYLGTAARNLSDVANGGGVKSVQREIIFGVGLAVTVIVVGLITWLAAREIRREMRATTSGRSKGGAAAAAAAAAGRGGGGGGSSDGLGPRRRPGTTVQA